MKNANVFWISIDSLRKDFLNVYNPAFRQTYLDELAASGCLFDDAVAGGNWTMPSHATMLTGLDTTSHMIWSWQHRFQQNVQTAFDIFHRAGYTVGAYAIPQLAELFADRPIHHAGPCDAPSLLKCLESPNPFFVFWHTYKVHYPYGIEVPVEFDEDATDYDLGARPVCYIRHLVMNGANDVISAAYRRQFQNVAREVQGVAAKLKKLGKYEKTYFIITADHGEAWEPFTNFHCNFKEEVVRVPLAIAGPELVPSRVRRPVGLGSLLPTVMELCGLDDEAVFEGFDAESLLPIIFNKTIPDHPLVIGGPDGGRRLRFISVRQGDWVLIRALNHWWESFHQLRDSQLSGNLLDGPLAVEAQTALGEFRSVAERHAERYSSKKDNVVPLSKATESKLRALGYV